MCPVPPVVFTYRTPLCPSLSRASGGVHLSRPFVPLVLCLRWSSPVAPLTRILQRPGHTKTPLTTPAPSTQAFAFRPFLLKRNLRTRPLRPRDTQATKGVGYKSTVELRSPPCDQGRLPEISGSSDMKGKVRTPCEARGGLRDAS